MTPKLLMTDQPAPQMRQAILAPLLRFNDARSRQPPGYRPLAILLLHPTTDEIMGGLWSATAYAHLHIDLLFVPETLRGTGVGRQLLAQAESEAVQRGCRGAWLDTFSFQARGFYERLGYTVFGTIDDYPPGHRRFFLQKTLGRGTDAP